MLPQSKIFIYIWTYFASSKLLASERRMERGKYIFCSHICQLSDTVAKPLRPTYKKDLCHMCLCWYVHMCVPMCVHMCATVYACMYEGMHVYVYRCVCMCVYRCVHAGQKSTSCHSSGAVYLDFCRGGRGFFLLLRPGTRTLPISQGWLATELQGSCSLPSPSPPRLGSQEHKCSPNACTLPTE